eukprot:snap_masked-scaffold_17-processed-gene-2.44-mRNA-1 protein AED:1.00 eAED:1.00 QI:0/-1/0/0/-1/1/1/0/558
MNLESLVSLSKKGLEELIEKPKASEKLLNRPPFRFLFDIVFNLDKKSGFLKGLLGQNNFTTGKIKEKSEKIKFIDLIKTFAKNSGIEPEIEYELNPAKVLAGLDCEQTNKFLLHLIQINKSYVRHSTEKEEKIREEPSLPHISQRQHVEQESKSEKEESSSKRASTHSSSQKTRSSKSTTNSNSHEVEKAALKTLSILEHLVLKPKLTKKHIKHLKRPPIKFLRDIFAGLQSRFGLFPQLTGSYIASELKSKEEKVRFMRLIFGELKNIHEVDVEKYSIEKILAGVDVLSTNDLLQQVGRIAELKKTIATSKEKVEPRKRVGLNSQNEKNSPRIVQAAAKTKQDEVKEVARSTTRPQTAKKKPPRRKETPPKSKETEVKMEKEEILLDGEVMEHSESSNEVDSVQEEKDEPQVVIAEHEEKKEVKEESSEEKEQMEEEIEGAFATEDFKLKQQKEEIYRLKNLVELAGKEVRPLAKYAARFESDMKKMEEEEIKWKQNYKKGLELLEVEKERTKQLLYPYLQKSKLLDEKISSAKAREACLKLKIQQNQTKLEYIIGC